MENKSVLVGMFFLTFQDNELGWQGMIEKEIGFGFYLCQLFSWLDGSPTDCVIVHLKDMSSWYLHKDQEDWVNAARQYGKGSK
jgi:hypothetical protein